MLDHHTVYRIETAGGRGIYCDHGSQASRIANDYFCEPRRHPQPFDDGLLGDWYEHHFDKERHKFAFASLDQLKFWFYRYRAKLAAHGAKVVVIEAPAILGETQAIYDADAAVYVDELDLATI